MTAYHMSRDGFISNDKKSITLPITFGEFAFLFSTDCNNACISQKEKFRELFPSRENWCCGTMPCHVYERPIVKIKLEWSKLDFILGEWGTSVFETEEEAREAMEKLIKKNKQTLLDLGLLI